MPLDRQEESRNERAQLDQQISSLFDYDDDDGDYSYSDKPSKKSRGLFKRRRKSKEDSYDDDFSEDFYDDSYDNSYEDDFEEELEERPVKKQKAKPKKQSKQKKKKQARPKRKKQKRDDYDDYDDYPEDDAPVFYDKDGEILPDLQKEPLNVKKIVLWVTGILAISLVVLTLWGWYNTDYDSKGNAYVVPLELYPERAYMNKSDEVLQTILTIDQTFDEDTYYLPSDYTNMYAKLTNMQTTLKEKTTSLSRYVNVPSAYSNYNETLINFSLSIQECIDNLISNKDNSDYEEYREQIMSEYYQDLNSVKKMRQELETRLFRNLPENESELKIESSDSNSSSSSSKNSSSSSSSSSSKNGSSSSKSSNSNSSSSSSDNSKSSSSGYGSSYSASSDDEDDDSDENSNDSSSSSSSSTNSKTFSDEEIDSLLDDDD